MKYAIVLVVMLSGCASYHSWKSDPFGAKARENAAYWDGWRVGYREGLNALVRKP